MERSAGIEQVDLSMTPGVAFESQLVEEIPLEKHDIVMDWVITETAVYSRHRDF